MEQSGIQVRANHFAHKGASDGCEKAARLCVLVRSARDSSRDPASSISDRLTDFPISFPAVQKKRF